jgi:hypothetical protein
MGVTSRRGSGGAPPVNENRQPGAESFDRRRGADGDHSYRSSSAKMLEPFSKIRVPRNDALFDAEHAGALGRNLPARPLEVENSGFQ